jgi:hypothetical protein
MKRFWSFCPRPCLLLASLLLSKPCPTPADPIVVAGTGQVGINTNNPTAGYQLDVNGDTLVRGSVTAANLVFPMDAKPGMTTAFVSETSFSVSKGARLSDDGLASMGTSTAMSKSVSQPWSPGNDGGAMDTGSIPSGGILHVYAISREDGEVDYLCSNPAVTAAGSPALPNGFTHKRYLGSLFLSGGSIIPFFVTSEGGSRRVTFKDVQVPISAVTPATAGTLYSVLAPTGFSCIVFGVLNQSSVVNASRAVSVTSPLGNNQASASGLFDLGGTGFRGLTGSYVPSGHDGNTSFSFLAIPTDTENRIRLAVNAACAVTFQQWGYIEAGMAFTGYE